MVSTSAAVTQCRVRAASEYPGARSLAIGCPSGPAAQTSGREPRLVLDLFNRLGRFRQRRNDMAELVAGARRLGGEVTAVIGVDRRLDRHAAGNLATILGP